MLAGAPATARTASYASRCFLGVAGVHQREQREGGVAQPAKAVVQFRAPPSFSGSDVVGGGDDAAGRPIVKALA